MRNEHDEWSRRVADIIFKYQENERLAILPAFEEFDKHIGGLLHDTKSLYLEGKKQSHCVATYANAVNSGWSGIYHVKGYTLELGIKNVDNRRELKVKQFRGFRNAPAPEELTQDIENKLRDFNMTYKFNTEDKARGRETWVNWV